jgi:hypothetical protein
MWWQWWNYRINPAKLDNASQGFQHANSLKSNWIHSRPLHLCAKVPQTLASVI